MPRSIRWRLQGWYALVLLAVVGGFAGILYYRVRAARLQEVDAALEAGARYLDAHLRRFPPHELDGGFAGKPPPPKGKDKKRGGPWPPPPKGPSPKRLLAELNLPGAAEGQRSAGVYFGVWRSDGSLLKGIGVPEGVRGGEFTGLRPDPNPRLTRRGDFREAHMTGPHRTHILVGRSLQAEEEDLLAFAWQLAGAGAVVLAVGLLGGWVISARILRPVAAIAATAAQISETNLSRRIDPKAVDRELAELAQILNATFDRLQAAFERQARFTADASHELRTPLAIVRTQAEVALSRPRSAEEYRDTVAACLRAASRMSALVEGLLLLARADAGRLDLQRTAVDLGQVVEETVAMFRPLAEERGVTFTACLARGEVNGDAVRLAQVITNLLSNAVQHNRDGGEVRVTLQVSAGEVVLTVADDGCGIPEEDRAHIFERFYRVDKARARSSGGNGLGLAICRSIVDAHGGRIGFETEVGRGSTFWVRLPCATAQRN
jgi:heavy metal sensor kinase